jgi:hypothetical protein
LPALCASKGMRMTLSEALRQGSSAPQNSLPSSCACAHCACAWTPQGQALQGRMLLLRVLEEARSPQGACHTWNPRPGLLECAWSLWVHLINKASDHLLFRYRDSIASKTFAYTMGGSAVEQQQLEPESACARGDDKS